jgi:hypothetical protein
MWTVMTVTVLQDSQGPTAIPLPLLSMLTIRVYHGIRWNLRVFDKLNTNADIIFFGGMLPATLFLFWMPLTGIQMSMCALVCMYVCLRSSEAERLTVVFGSKTNTRAYSHTSMFLSLPASIYPSIPITVRMLRILLGRTLIKAHNPNLSLNYPHRLSAERKIEDGGKESGESLQMLSTFAQLSEYYFRHEFAFDTIPVVLYYILTFTLPIPHDDGKHVNAILAVWWTF